MINHEDITKTIGDIKNAKYLHETIEKKKKEEVNQQQFIADTEYKMNLDNLLKRQQQEIENFLDTRKHKRELLVKDQQNELRTTECKTNIILDWFDKKDKKKPIPENLPIKGLIKPFIHLEQQVGEKKLPPIRPPPISPEEWKQQKLQNRTLDKEKPKRVRKCVHKERYARSFNPNDKRFNPRNAMEALKRRFAKFTQPKDDSPTTKRRRKRKDDEDLFDYNEFYEAMRNPAHLKPKKKKPKKKEKPKTTPLFKPVEKKLDAKSVLNKSRAIEKKNRKERIAAQKKWNKTSPTKKVNIEYEYEYFYSYEYEEDDNENNQEGELADKKETSPHKKIRVKQKRKITPSVKEKQKMMESIRAKSNEVTEYLNSKQNDSSNNLSKRDDTSFKRRTRVSRPKKLRLHKFDKDGNLIDSGSSPIQYYSEDESQSVSGTRSRRKIHGKDDNTIVEEPSSEIGNEKFSGKNQRNKQDNLSSRSHDSEKGNLSSRSHRSERDHLSSRSHQSGRDHLSSRSHRNGKDHISSRSHHNGKDNLGSRHRHTRRHHSNREHHTNENRDSNINPETGELIDENYSYYSYYSYSSYNDQEGNENIDDLLENGSPRYQNNNEQNPQIENENKVNEKHLRNLSSGTHFINSEGEIFNKVKKKKKKAADQKNKIRKRVKGNPIYKHHNNNSEDGYYSEEEYEYQYEYNYESNTGDDYEYYYDFEKEDKEEYYKKKADLNQNKANTMGNSMNTLDSFLDNPLNNPLYNSLNATLNNTLDTFLNTPLKSQTEIINDDTTNKENNGITIIRRPYVPKLEISSAEPYNTLEKENSLKDSPLNIPIKSKTHSTTPIKNKSKNTPNDAKTPFKLEKLSETSRATARLFIPTNDISQSPTYFHQSAVRTLSTGIQKIKH